jgi:inorganic triphosphatase YgiF
MNSGSPNSTETETTLVVASENPAIILGKIGEISSISDYQMLPGGTFTLIDHYFDSYSRELSSRKWALRIRQTDEQSWIAAKGPSQEIRPGILERAEIELAWSAEAFDKLSNLLARHGLFISGLRKSGISQGPLEVLRNAGLIVIQKRQTVRTVRHILSTEKDFILAELVLDRVTYYFESRALLHHEIEIEFKSKEAYSAAQFVTPYLLALFPTELRKWRYGKLATGSAIEALVGEKSFKESLSWDHLKPASYDLIEAYLNARTKNGADKFD